MAHLALEDGLYFPALRGLRPVLAEDLDRLEAEHQQLREQLARVARSIEHAPCDACVPLLEHLGGELADHEGREEGLLASITEGRQRTMRIGTCARWLVSGWLALALPAGAAEEACDAWFPDFNCERSGRFDGFEQPIVAPYLFEDPFITTNAVPYFLWHDFPEQSVWSHARACVWDQWR